jgi:shikimate kinase
LPTWPPEWSCRGDRGRCRVLRPENRQNLRASGLVIYLDVPLPTLHERTRHDKKRPLLQVSDPRQKLRELHAQRDPLYRESPT